MIISTSKYLSPEADKKGQKINSIKIDFSKMTFIAKTNDPYTQCPHCRGILIEEDKKNPIVKNKKGEFIWTCRFCKRQSVSQTLNYVGNDYKVAIEKNLKSKITPPIILFVIDNSGSMYQSIFHGMKYGSNPKMINEAKSNLSVQIMEIITESTLYKQQRQLMNKYQKSYTQIIHKQKYREQEISKIVLLYGVIEHSLKQLTEKAKRADYRVGFIFFSDMIYVLKGSKQKQIPVYVQTGQLCHEEWPYQKTSVNYYDYDQLYKVGTGYEKYFGDSRLQKFDVGKVAVGKVKGGGKTALGPALALAMGIISMHDQGSRVIVATDSFPNFGILQKNDGDQIYKRIGTCLQQNNATLSIFKWSGEQMDKLKEQESFIKFKSVFRSHVDQIQLNLAKCKGVDYLQLSFLSLNKLISHEAIGHSCEISILCDSSKIKLSKMPFESLEYSEVRFLSSKSNCWLTLGLDAATLEEYDYLFPVLTQTVTTYADLFTKQKYLCMSYTKQMLARKLTGQQPNRSEVALQGQEINIDNLSELCDMQLGDMFSKTRHSEEMSEFMTSYRYKGIEFQRQLGEGGQTLLKTQEYDQL